MTLTLGHHHCYETACHRPSVGNLSCQQRPLSLPCKFLTFTLSCHEIWNHNECMLPLWSLQWGSVSRLRLYLIQLSDTPWTQLTMHVCKLSWTDTNLKFSPDADVIVDAKKQMQKGCGPKCRYPHNFGNHPSCKDGATKLDTYCVGTAKAISGGQAYVDTCIGLDLLLVQQQHIQVVIILTLQPPHICHEMWNHVNFAVLSPMVLAKVACHFIILNYYTVT